MSIQLDSKTSIRSDAHCWMLVRTITRKAKEGGGENEYYTATYHPTLSATLQKYVDEELKASESVKELLSRLRDVDRRLEEAFKDVPKAAFK